VHRRLRQALQQLGWSEGHNIQFDQRFGGAGDSDLVRRHAQELVALAPDLVVVSGSQNVAALQQVSRTVPIVFVGIVDPVGAGFVASLARPGGNTTGFTSFEYGMSAKWLQLLKEIDPRVTRAAVLRDAVNPASLGLLAAMQGVAPSFRVELSPMNVRDAPEVERPNLLRPGRGRDSRLGNRQLNRRLRHAPLRCHDEENIEVAGGDHRDAFGGGSRRV
jgi:putative ABC transport system substrate-binding protein